MSSTSSRPNNKLSGVQKAEGHFSPSGFTGLYQVALLVYLCLCLLFFESRTISPLMDYLNTTPLKDLMTWLRHAGVVFIAAGLFTKLPSRRNPKAFLLYAICLIAAISSYVQRQYGYKTNLSAVLWMLIVYVLFYNLSARIGRGLLHRVLRLVYIVSAPLWSTACLLSLCQFVLLIGINGPNYASSPLLGGRGFYLNRLFGLFNTPEYGAIGALVFLLWGGYYLWTSHSRILRAYVSLICLPLFCYIAVSVSRNAAVALFLAVFSGAWLLFRGHFSRLPGEVQKPVLRSFLCALGVLSAAVVLYLLTQRIAEQLPARFAENAEKEVSIDVAPSEETSVSGSPALSLQSSDTARPLAAKALVSPALEDTEQAKVSRTNIRNRDSSLSVSSRQNPVKQLHPAAGSTPQQAAPEDNTNLLHREEVESDLSNGRFKIWGDYLSLYREFNLIGVSPGNSARFIQEHAPDLFICTHIKEVYPDNYKRGYVFHPHNGYLKLFASTGFLGLLCLLLFIGFNAVPVVNYIRRHPDPAPEFVFSFLIVLAGGSAAMFDTELFFVMVPTTLIFWTALGILLSIVSADSGTDKEKEKEEKQNRIK